MSVALLVGLLLLPLRMPLAPPLPFLYGPAHRPPLSLHSQAGGQGGKEGRWTDTKEDKCSEGFWERVSTRANGKVSG